MDKERLVQASQVVSQLLARRDYSVYEIEQKLKHKRYTSSEINLVIERFLERGWLDDNRTAETFVRHYYEQCYGPLAIVFKLKAKRIATDVIAAHIANGDFDWCERARFLYEKKFGQYVDQKEKARQIRYMLNRGYRQQEIGPLFSELEFS